MDKKSVPIKCVVWDLDNTLWRGILSEGDKVSLFPGIRESIKELDDRGILQSVASKNDFDLAWEQLVEFGLDQYFILPQIGWHPKSESIKELIFRLNFAEQAFAFVDDQGAERAEVQFKFPAVRCYPSEDLTDLIDRSEFHPGVVTVDSKKRRKMYQAGIVRDEARQSFQGPDEEFVKSLNIDLVIRNADDEYLSRLEELTLRTSQMNATGVHYDAHQLSTYCRDNTHTVLVITMDDIFGTHGAIGVMLIERFPMVWRLKLLATSCRVVSYGIGALLLNWLINEASSRNVHLIADFRATDRNRMMEVAYRFAGFVDESCPCSMDIPASNMTRFHLLPLKRKLTDNIRISAVSL